MKAYKLKKTNKIDDYIEASDWASKKAKRLTANFRF
jgi:hypothetical protein